MSLLPLLSLSLFLLTTQTYSSFSPNCEPFMCGTNNISYPFSLYDQSTPEHCGIPGFLVSCENEAPILHLQDGDYAIRSINYDNNTITLVNTDILNYLTNCPIVRNFSLLTGFGVSYTSSDVNLVFFYYCDSSAENISTPLSCLDHEYGYSFVFDTRPLASNSSLNNNLMGCCSEVVMAPVLDYYLDQYSANLSTSFGNVLTNGFQLGWNFTDKCTGCHYSLGQCGYTLLADSKTYANFSCFCANNSCGSADHANKSHPYAEVGIGISSFIGLLAFCIFLLFYARKNKKILIATEERKKEAFIEVNLEYFGSLAPKRYTFSEIRKITKSFNQKIGQGGYASVFKGELMDGSPVAVKLFKDLKSTGVEFISEVLSIARTSHVNIIRLLGFSIKGSKRALIYEFMSNGSLDKYLRENQNSKLSDAEYTRLFEIAVGIARGLEYLHRGCNSRIVHFDIKPHNILLDQDYCPKISDFGLAKFCQPKESIISMSGMRGTIGYIAPEVFSRNFGPVSSKSDVYSYGMMLLEMFVGKQGKMELKDFSSSTETYFPDYIYKCVEQNNICSVYGISDGSAEVVQKATIIGLCCVQMMPHLRPTMSEVLDMLAKRVEELTLPPSSNVILAPVLVQEAIGITASISCDQ